MCFHLFWSWSENEWKERNREIRKKKTEQDKIKTQSRKPWLALLKTVFKQLSCQSQMRDIILKSWFFFNIVTICDDSMYLYIKKTVRERLKRGSKIKYKTSEREKNVLWKKGTWKKTCGNVRKSWIQMPQQYKGEVGSLVSSWEGTEPETVPVSGKD